MVFTPEQAKFLIDHCFLPLKLPQKSDEESGAGELLAQFEDVAQSYSKYLTFDERRHWAPISRSIVSWRDLYNDGNMCESTLVDSIGKMHQNSVLLVFIQAQNAAIMLTKLEHGTKFEAWEVSARQEDVLSANDALERYFPARAVEIHSSKMTDARFLKELASHIHKLSVEVSVQQSMETVQKARKDVEESRQAKHPRLVTEWLFSILQVKGQHSQSKSVTKRTHDDLNFFEAQFPFRRSSILQSIKVALQLAVFNSPLGEQKHKHYKQFMLCFLSQLSLRLLPTQQPLEYLHVLRAKLARRAAKLQLIMADSTMPNFVGDIFMHAVTQISESMNKQWDIVQARDDAHVPCLSMGNGDKAVQLVKSGAQLEILCRQASDEVKQLPGHFTPSFSTPLILPPDKLPDPLIFNTTGEQLVEHLAVFEVWVVNNLQAWLNITTPADTSCQHLKALIDRYWNSARATFSPFAELMSGVLLAILSSGWPSTRWRPSSVRCC